MDKRELILGAVDDLVMDLLNYDRKECEDLPMDEIQKSLANGETTIDEMVGQFRKSLTEGL